jgi:hypothetical protein
MCRFRGLTALPSLLLAMTTSAAAFAQADIPPGKYECWHFSTPLPGMAFTIKGGGQYVDVEGKSGTYTLSNGQIAFRGGAFDGQHAVFRAGRPPTIAILDPSGGETESCQPPG